MLETRSAVTKQQKEKKMKRKRTGTKRSKEVRSLMYRSKWNMVHADKRKTKKTEQKEKQLILCEEEEE